MFCYLPRISLITTWQEPWDLPTQCATGCPEFSEWIVSHVERKRTQIRTTEKAEEEHGKGYSCSKYERSRSTTLLNGRGWISRWRIFFAKPLFLVRKIRAIHILQVRGPLLLLLSLPNDNFRNHFSLASARSRFLSASPLFVSLAPCLQSPLLGQILDVFASVQGKARLETENFWWKLKILGFAPLDSSRAGCHSYHAVTFCLSVCLSLSLSCDRGKPDLINVLTPLVRINFLMDGKATTSVTNSLNPFFGMNNRRLEVITNWNEQ